MANKKALPKYKKYRVSSKARESFTTNLALMLRAAVPVGETLDSLQETTHSAEMQGALQQMKRDIDDGMALWKALERSGIVSNQTMALVRLGEQSGNLVENLLVAAKQEEKQRIFKSKVRSALLYPTFVLGITAVVGIGVAWFLLPRLAVTFKQLNLKLPLISRIFIGLGTFLQHNGFWAVPLGLALTLIIGYILFGAPKTRTLGQRFLFRVPGVSAMLQQVEIARFGYLFGTLLNAGLTITEALTLLYDATTTVKYKKLYKYLNKSFEEGYSFKTGFANYKHVDKLLPPAVMQMIIAGERSGALPETLLSVGTIYEEKADIATQNLEAILEPILLIIVWLGVLGVAVAVILPIYSLVGGLRGGQ